MQRVPHGTEALVSSRARIVIAKSVQGEIPHRPEFGNQQRFAERNPNIIDDQPSRLEVGNVEVSSGSYALCVVLKSTGESVPLRSRRTEHPFSSATRMAFPT